MKNRWIVMDHQSGIPVKEIARMRGCTPANIYRILREQGQPVKLHIGPLIAREMRELYHANGLSYADIGEEYGVHGNTVARHIRSLDLPCEEATAPRRNQRLPQPQA